MKNSIEAREILSVTIAGSLALIICSTHFLSGFSNVYGDEVFSPNEKPFGIPYNEWVGKYWKWAITMTPEQSDPPNGSCLMNKTDSMVMVLQPAVGGKHELVCDITSKDAIMIPSWNAFIENNNKDDKPANYPPQQLSILAKKADTGAVTSEVRVDGKSVAKLDENTPEGGSTKVNTMQNFSEILAKPFNITIPENTFLSDQVPGTWPSGAHGWFAFLKPLPPGDHTVSYNLSVQGLGAENVSSETTYIFHVKSNQTGNSTINMPSNGSKLNSTIQGIPQ